MFSSVSEIFLSSLHAKIKLDESGWFILQLANTVYYFSIFIKCLSLSLRWTKPESLPVTLFPFKEAGLMQWWERYSSTSVSRFDSRTWRQKWVEFVGFQLCYKRFISGYTSFPLFDLQSPQ